MKKSLLFISLCLLTSAICLAQETIDKGNVRYTIASSSSNSSTKINKDQVLGCTFDKSTATIQETKRTTTTTTITNQLTIESFLSNSPTIGGWELDPVSGAVESGTKTIDYQLSKSTSASESAKNALVEYAAGNSLVVLTKAGIDAKNYSDDAVAVASGKETTWGKIKNAAAFQNCLFYVTVELGYDDDWNEVEVPTITVINKITSQVTTNDTPVDKNIYSFTSIPTGLSLGALTNITIGGTIKSIADGAFASATSLKTINNNSTSFVLDSNGFLYTANYAKLVAVPATIKGTSSSQKEYTLPEATSAVAANALGNVNYVTLYSIERISQPTLGGTGNILTTNTTDLLQGTVKYEPTSNAFIYTGEHNGQVPTGDVTRQNLLDLISGLSENADVAYIDLTQSTVVFKQHDLGEITGLKNNCLLYLPAGITATGNNVIIDGKCKNLVLTDKKTFYAPYKFEVTGTAKYTGRTFTEGTYGTTILPFAITSANTVTVGGTAGKYGDAFRVASLNSYTSNGDIKFQYQDAMEANKAYLIKPSTTFSEIIVSDADGITVPKTPVKPMEYSVGTGDASAMFAGSFTQGKTKLTASETSTDQDATRYVAGSSAWGLNSSGKMAKVASGKTVTLYPFRAMFVITDPITTAASTKHAFRVFEYAETNEGEEDIEIEEDEATEIESVSAVPASVSVETQRGQLVVSAEGANVNVASVSGTVYYSGKVAGQKSFDLPAGIYVVNGKKYIVK